MYVPGWTCWQVCGACWTESCSPSDYSEGPPPDTSAPCSKLKGGSKEVAEIRMCDNRMLSMVSPCTKKILCRMLNIQVYLGGKMINNFIPLIKPWDFQQ